MPDFVTINDKKHTHLPKLLMLYQESFPECERQTIEVLLNKIETEEKFFCNALINNDEFVGLFNYWTFEDFYYIEHFAISEQQRGKKMGSIVLDKFIKSSPFPIILEVELPITQQAQSRISFYKRLGFDVFSKSYIQPPYQLNGEKIPMYLLSNGYADEKKATQTLYKHVYRCGD